MKSTSGTERTSRLKERMLAARPEICVERARYLTESFRRTESEPRAIRLAKAFDNVLRRMTIFIQEDEIIVGNRTGKHRGSPLFPETQCSWIGPQLDVIPRRFAQRFYISEPEKRELRRDILPYWKGKNAWERALELMPKQVQKDVYKNLFIMRAEFSNGVGHYLPNHELVVREGLASVRARAEENLRRLERRRGSEDGKNFLRAAIISMNAAEHFANRFAAEAERLAERESDPKRKQELRKIAEACGRVPMLPARDFHEGLQAVWFNQLLCQIEDGGFAISIGRLDQILWPLYKQNIEKKTLNRGEAREMIECFYVKLSEVVNCLDTVVVPAAGGPPIAQNLTVGGQGEDGNDATNELSFLCLEAMASIRTVMPNFSVRIHPGAPDNFLLEACRAARDGVMLGLFNDEEIIPALVNRGIPLRKARCYGIVGCVEPAVPGETFGSTDSNLFNIAKCLELALRDGDGIDLLLNGKTLVKSFSGLFKDGGGGNGKDSLAGFARRLSRIGDAGRLFLNVFTEKNLKLGLLDQFEILRGRKFGPRTGDPAGFESIDGVIEAYRSQMAYFVKSMVDSMEAGGRAIAELKPTPYISCTVLGCVDRAKDVSAGGARYNFTGPQAIGVANVGDSLAAIDRLVFREKIYTMRELLNVIDKNYEGEEPMRRRLLTREPRYGNDDDSADRFARIAAEVYCGEVEKHANYRGGKFQPGIYSITGHIVLGALTGATPDGRRAGEPLAEGVSPARGSERRGPTAVLKSASKLNYKLTSNGVVLNMRFHPEAFRAEENVKKFAAMNRAYFMQGGSHVQYNIVGAETLKDAQKNPDNHRDLVVRVAGYSAAFTELDPAAQDDIIRRTEHQFIQ